MKNIIKNTVKIMSVVLILSSLVGDYAVNAEEQESKNLETAVSDTQMTIEEIREYYNVDEIADEYGVDAQQLANNIYEGIHSDRFSPFTELETTKSSEKTMDNFIMRGSPVYSQDSTMYLETGNACASGNYPYVGCVAVHKKSTTDRTPIIPFGTRINYISGSVDINGIYYDSFIVEDTGDAKFIRSTYWTDIYGGANIEANRTMAYNYGVKTVVISWD